MKSGGRASRDKGNRSERALVAILQEAGFAAERVPLSGSAGGRFNADVSVSLLRRDVRAEVKVRCHGFRELYRWSRVPISWSSAPTGANSLVVLPLRRAIEIAQAAERGRTANFAPARTPMRCGPR